ncbi:MAG TPA: hypothetical protein VE975_08885 [Actinomycetota bacterium]|jgi:hypothetical protein|nr:hypothetical protein [Actinomycetota bacterium]
MIELLVFGAGVVAFAAAARLFGVDSRDGDDWVNHWKESPPPQGHRVWVRGD